MTAAVTATATDTVPVLIVGAGPTGLTLACDLARRGVACRVIDRAPQLFIGSRGKGLQPRTLEVFDDLGVIDAILAGGIPFPPFRLYAGSTIVWERSLAEMLPGALPAPSARVPYAKPWLIPQSRTDAILHDRFAALGGRVELATTLVGFEQDDEGVRATVVRDNVTHTVRAQYLVGADGGRSFVRKASGARFEGETYDTERTLIGDVGVTGLDGVACHMLTRDGDPRTRFSLWNLPGSERPDGVYQLVATMPTEETPELSLSSVQRLLDERSGRTDIRLRDLRWISRYRVNVRMVDRFRIGRVLLAGDAAHVHSSAGGQGLNTSVQDAYNLGWKLAAVLNGADALLLDTYEQERWPVAAHVLGATALLHRRGFQPAETAAPAIHQLDISYRDGPLAVDDLHATGPLHARGDLRAGDRAADAQLPDGTRLFDLFRGPHFTLLAFGSSSTEIAVDGRVRVHRLSRVDGYEIPEPALVLVRPDGYIGAITSSIDTVRRYLRRVL